jgi:hypothetical protein
VSQPANQKLVKISGSVYRGWEERQFDSPKSSVCPVHLGGWWVVLNLMGAFDTNLMKLLGFSKGFAESTPSSLPTLTPAAKA